MIENVEAEAVSAQPTTALTIGLNFLQSPRPFWKQIGYIIQAVDQHDSIKLIPALQVRFEFLQFPAGIPSDSSQSMHFPIRMICTQQVWKTTLHTLHSMSGGK